MRVFFFLKLTRFFSSQSFLPPRPTSRLQLHLDAARNVGREGLVRGIEALGRGEAQTLRPEGEHHPGRCSIAPAGPAALNLRNPQVCSVSVSCPPPLPSTTRMRWFVTGSTGLSWSYISKNAFPPQFQFGTDLKRNAHQMEQWRGGSSHHSLKAAVFR